MKDFLEIIGITGLLALIVMAFSVVMVLLAKWLDFLMGVL